MFYLIRVVGAEQDWIENQEYEIVHSILDVKPAESFATGVYGNTAPKEHML